MQSAWRRFLLQAVINGLTACVLAFTHADTVLCFLLLLPLVAATLHIHRARGMVWTFWLFVLMGFAGEVWAVHWDVWHYDVWDVLGIPLYIGPAWGLMAVFIASLYEALREWFKDNP